MPVFAYKALAANGSVTTGEIDAADRPEALRVLDKRGLQPVNLKESASATAATKKKAPAKSKSKPEETLRQPVAKADADDIPDGPVKLKRQ